jgi:hypothetical protein
MDELVLFAIAAFVGAIVAGVITRAVARAWAPGWSWALTGVAALASAVTFWISSTQGGYNALGTLVLAIVIGIVAFGAGLGSVIGTVWPKKS